MASLARPNAAPLEAYGCRLKSSQRSHIWMVVLKTFNFFGLHRSNDTVLSGPRGRLLNFLISCGGSRPFYAPQVIHSRRDRLADGRSDWLSPHVYFFVVGPSEKIKLCFCCVCRVLTAELKTNEKLFSSLDVRPYGLDRFCNFCILLCFSFIFMNQFSPCVALKCVFENVA